MNNRSLDDDHPTYLSYMLRMWATEDGGRVIWRASLESSRTGTRLSFATVEVLLTFIAAQTVDFQDLEPEEPGT